MLSEVILENHNQFNLFNSLTKDEIKETKEFLDNNLTYNKQIYYDMINLNINEENIYEILWMCDILQYKKYEELKEHIQLQILDNNIYIDKDNLNKDVMYDDIYENECLKYQECKCNYEVINNIINMRHIICFKYLETKNIKCNYICDLFNSACETGNIKFIKYLHKIGYKGNVDAINYAAKNRNLSDDAFSMLEVIKYLHKIGYKGSENAINNAAENKHLELIIYLHEYEYIGNLLAIYYAEKNGHLEVIKYLHNLGYKSDKWVTYYAVRYRYPKIIVYLHEFGYKGNVDAINYAAKNGNLSGDAFSKPDLEIFKYLQELGYQKIMMIIQAIIIY